MARIHVLIDEREKARYRLRAEREGKSLGAWLREAAEDKLAASECRTRLETVADLERFFNACDAREEGQEPDWSAHKHVIDKSRAQGVDVT